MMYVKNRIKVDDSAILDTLSLNNKLSSYGKLSQDIVKIKNAYSQYISAEGNPWKLNSPLALIADLPASLKSHYKSEVSGLEFISKIRNEMCNASCPMCGSTLPPDTVDHVIPKEAYPEFSVFSENLVSACRCNSKKGTSFKGANVDERVFHPYFDKLMSERLVFVGFSGELTKPTFEIKLIATHANNRTLQFHVENVLKKTTVLRHSYNNWGVISDQPGLALTIRPSERWGYDLTRLIQDLKEKIRLYDRKHESLNNWESMFYFGLLQSGPHLDMVLKRLKSGY